MKSIWRDILGGLIGFPLIVLMYIVFIHVVSLLDPILTFVLGGGFILALLVGGFNFIINLKDFIVSIFKDDKTKDKRGFKKHF